MYVLADMASRAGWSTFVGQRRLAGQTELSVRTVRRVLQDLERDGLIRRERRGDIHRGRQTDVTVLVRRAIASLPLVTDEVSDQADAVTARTDAFNRPTNDVQPANQGRSSGQSLAGHEPFVPTEPHQADTLTGRTEPTWSDRPLRDAVPWRTGGRTAYIPARVGAESR